MAYECGLLDPILLEEKLDVPGQRGIVVPWIVGRVSMVSGVDRVDWAVQLAGEDSAWCVSGCSQAAGFRGMGSYLLMLLLFFLLPKRPWMKTIAGAFCATPEEALGGRCRS